MNDKNKKIPAELAPCGIFCGACPSFNNSCFGCASDDKQQKRKSKWSCKIRTCAYSAHNIDFCFECEEFPCKELGRKLYKSHPDDPRFQYRHEVIQNLEKLSNLGVENYLKYQNEKWQCPSCKGKIHWFDYRCSQCNQDFSTNCKNFS